MLSLKLHGALVVSHGDARSGRFFSLSESYPLEIWKWHARCATWGTATTRKKNLPGCVGHPGILVEGLWKYFPGIFNGIYAKDPNTRQWLFDASLLVNPSPRVSLGVVTHFSHGYYDEKSFLHFVWQLLPVVMRCCLPDFAWIGFLSHEPYKTAFQVDEILILNPSR